MDPQDPRACRDLARRGLWGSLAYAAAWLILVYGTPLHFQLGGWWQGIFVALALLGVVRFVLGWRFADFFAGSSQRWLQLYQMSVLGLAGVYTLGASWIVYRYPTEWYSFFVTATMVAIAAGGAISLSTHLWLQRPFLVVTLVPPAIVSFWNAEETTYGTAILYLAGLVYLTVFGRDLHRQYWASLQSMRLLAERAQQLEDARTRAEDMARSKSEFFANMSHELRTPLNAILGFAQIISRSENLSRQDRANLETINRSGAHLLSLINQVLDLAKIEAGRAVYEPRICHLPGMLDDLRKMFQLRAQKKSLTFSFEVSDDLPSYIWVDELKLRQVLINLLDNAIKFTTEGSVTLQVRRQPSGGPMDEEARLDFEVSDTGPGIGNAEQAQLFNAFAQTSTGRKFQEGAGLGLALSQSFVALMKGRIRLSSRPLIGSTFQFEIRVPLAQPPAEKSAQSGKRAVGLAAGQRPFRVLIVDDEPDNRSVLAQLHRPFGFTVLEAANGADAIDRWECDEPDLVWMDLRMPGIDGYEATRRIREAERFVDPARSRTAILAITAGLPEEQGEELRQRGFDGIVRKPFKEAAIVQALEAHLGAIFVYEDPRRPGQTPPVVSASPWTAAIGGQPTAWRKSLADAVRAVDYEATERLVAQIRSTAPSLSAHLHALLEQYRFDRLQAYLQPPAQERP
ncbi:MAG: ATP-binding protein [Verrucomicrobiota bacterium JB022]|nr:ATP-binding protein [Verrucomicrobiota bacterium JB022]